MIDSIKTILDKLDYKPNNEDKRLSEMFKENGYCVIPKSDFLSENIDEYRRIIDSLLQKESWRGGWEGKEEYMKYKKDFQPGANRLANLFNKNDLFLKLLTEKNILKTTCAILGDDIKVGGLDMREPKEGTGLQDLHIDWIPKKSEDEKAQNIVAMCFLDDADENNGHLRIVPKTHKKTGWIEENQDQTLSHPDQMCQDVKKSGIVLRAR
jgi:ectoine hydroxylase-related dioxygenase (phytanoyl-CoA dioxygenase family)